MSARCEHGHEPGLAPETWCPRCVNAQPAEPISCRMKFDDPVLRFCKFTTSEPIKLKNGEFYEFVTREAYDALNVQWRAKWEQALDSRDSLNAEIERLRARLDEVANDTLGRAEKFDALADKYLEARAAFEQEREYAQIIAQERDAARAEVERLRDMLDDLQLPKVGRELPSAAYEVERDVSADDELGIEYTKQKENT